MEIEPEYYVFLSHRGPDTKSGFMSHLEESLKDKGLKPFLDKKSLKKGDNVQKSIDHALRVVSVYVPVLSKRYAGSKNCLNELEFMIGSRKRVIPVFYGVEPDDLRLGENSLYAAEFEGHKYLEAPGRVAKWKDALRQLANISGFRSADYSGDEAKLKREVVDAVMSYINLLFTNDAEGHSCKSPAGTSSFGTLEQAGESSRGEIRSGAQTTNIFNIGNIYNTRNIGSFRNPNIAESMCRNPRNVGYSNYDPAISSRSPPIYAQLQHHQEALSICAQPWPQQEVLPACRGLSAESRINRRQGRRLMLEGRDPDVLLEVFTSELHAASSLLCRLLRHPDASPH